MRNIHYALRRFDLYPDGKNNILFYTPQISAKVTDENVIGFLTEIKQSGSLELSELQMDSLIDKHHLTKTPIKKYLTDELKLVSTLSEERFSSLFIDSDDKWVGNGLVDYFNAGHGLTVYDAIKPDKIDDKSIILFFRNHYHPDQFHEIYALSEKYDAWIFTAYIANNYLVIDNIFNARKGVPCHFCNFNRHHHIVQSKGELKRTSWANFCRQLWLDDIAILPAMPMTIAERCLTTFWLSAAVRKFIEPHGFNMFINETSRYSWVNLSTGESNQEQVSHWAFCQCLS